MRRFIYTYPTSVYTPPSYTPTANTLSYFKLNGNATDVTGNNNGTATNVTYVDGMYPGTFCANFNDSSSKIDCGSATNLSVGTTGSLTFICWIQATGNTGWNGIITKRATGSGPNCYWYGDAQYADGGGTAGVTAPFQSSLQVWNMFSWVYNRGSSVLQQYQNGEFVNSVAFGATTLTDASSNLWLGCQRGDRDFMQGNLQEVIIENIAWSASSIKSHFNTYKPDQELKQQGLVAHWDAGNVLSYPGTGTNWYSLIGTGNTGVLTNGPTYSASTGGCIILDGTNDYVLISNDGTIDFGTNPWSCSVWFYYNSKNTTAPYNDYASLLVFNQDGLILHGVAGANPDPCVILNDGGPKGNTPFTTGNWYCWTGTRNGTTVKNYVNGVQLTTSLNYSGWVAANLYEMGRGYDDGNGSGYLNGRIAISVIYNTTLTDGDVKYNWNKQKNRFGL